MALNALNAIALRTKFESWESSMHVSFRTSLDWLVVLESVSPPSVLSATCEINPKIFFYSDIPVRFFIKSNKFMQNIRFDWNFFREIERGWEKKFFSFLAVNHDEQNRAFLNMPRIRFWGLVMFDRVPKCISLIIIMSVARIFRRSTQDCWLLLKIQNLFFRFLYVHYKVY